MRIILCSLAFILTSSCTKVDIEKVCDVNDPLTELAWLSELVDDAEKNSKDIEVKKAILKDKESKKLNKKIEVFLVRTGSITKYYDCSGNKICESGGFTGSVCIDYEVIDSEIIYSN